MGIPAGAYTQYETPITLPTSTAMVSAIQRPHFLTNNITKLVNSNITRIVITGYAHATDPGSFSGTQQCSLKDGTFSETWNTNVTLNWAIDATAFEQMAPFEFEYLFNGDAWVDKGHTGAVLQMSQYPSTAIGWWHYNYTSASIYVNNVSHPLGIVGAEDTVGLYGYAGGTFTAYTGGYAPPSQHLDLDVKDAGTNNYIPNTTIGIYDPVHGEWRNSTCLYGACGFEDSGATHQYPLVIGNNYTLVASKDGYISDSQGVNFTYDHQLVTLLLTNLITPTPTIWPTISPTPTYDPNSKHLDVDIKNDWTNSYIMGSTIGIYDPVHGEWRNSTCLYGACGFQDSGATHQYPLVIGQDYTIAASYYGFTPVSKIVKFKEDHQLIELRLVPTYQQASHLDLDVKDAKTNGYLESTSIGIFDPLYNEWRNSTCITGACGFIDSGATHQYPLIIGHIYKLVAAAPYYTPIAQDVVFAYDHQLITLYLQPENVTSYLSLWLDVIDGSNGGWIYNSEIGIYDPVHDEWRNSTCLYGACGFKDTGVYHQYPLVLGNNYTVASSKTGYYPANDTITFNYDNQMVTLSLRPSSPNASVLHMDVDVKDASTKKYIQESTIGIYDPVHGEWRNSTCLYGACGFMDSGATHQWPLMYHNTYTITAAKAGYRSASQTLVVSEDHQLFTLYLTSNDKAFVTPLPTGREAQTAPTAEIWTSMLPGISGLLLVGCIFWVVGGGK